MPKEKSIPKVIQEELSYLDTNLAEGVEQNDDWSFNINRYCSCDTWNIF